LRSFSTISTMYCSTVCISSVRHIWMIFSSTVRHWKNIELMWNKLIIKSSFHIYILTQLNYSSRIFWLDSITWIKSSDSTWYWSRVRVQFKFSTQLVKQSKMMLNVKIYYFWIYYVIIFERLSCNKWIYFFSCCLHYLVALLIKYIVWCLILIRHTNC